MRQAQTIRRLAAVWLLLALGSGCGGTDSDEPPVVELDAPLLIQPAADATVLDSAAVVFRWRSVAEADSYRLRIGRDSALQVLDTVLLDVDTSLTVPLLPAVHWWSVQALAGDFSGPWSESRSLVVESVPTEVGVPSLTAPPNGLDQATAEALCFRWTIASTGAPSEFQLSTDAQFQLQDTSLTVAGGALCLELPLGLHFWRVRHVPRVGEPGSWSESRYLLIQAPATPSLLEPHSGTVVEGGVLDLSWSDVEEAASYQVELGRRPDFLSGDNLLHTCPTTTLQLAVDEALAGSWFWRVRGRNSNGVAGYWSTPRLVHVGEATILPKVQVDSPDLQLYGVVIDTLHSFSILELRLSARPAPEDGSTIDQLCWALDDTTHWTCSEAAAQSIRFTPEILSAGMHRLFVRATSTTGVSSMLVFPECLASEGAAVPIWSVRGLEGGLLVVDDNPSSSPNDEQWMRDALQQAGHAPGSFTYWPLDDEWLPGAETLLQILDSFHTVLWWSERQTQLEALCEVLEAYYTGGGHMLISSGDIGAVDNNGQPYLFPGLCLPIAEATNARSRILPAEDHPVLPVDSHSTDYPVLHLLQPTSMQGPGAGSLRFGILPGEDAEVLYYVPADPDNPVAYPLANVGLRQVDPGDSQHARLIYLSFSFHHIDLLSEFLDAALEDMGTP
jgi:hypothetical protein